MKKFDRFILFPWGMISREGERASKLLESIKECGFNASCFVPDTEFEKCRELGLEIYYTPDREHSAERSTDHEKLLMNPAATDDELRAAMYALLENVPHDVRSIYLNDEPGATLFHKLGIMTECVREKAPWLEAYINLFPNYAVCGAPNLSQLETATYEEYLERFAAEVHPDAISLDNYKVIISDNFKVQGGREQYFGNMLQAREVCDKYDLPFQFIACCNQLRDWLTIPTMGNLALQGYTALAAGARIISWFLYFSRGGYLYAPVDDTTGEDIITPTWYLLREVNRRILPLGEVLFDMDYKGMYFSKPDGLKGARPISECPAIKQFSSDEECMIGHYVDKDGRDVILVANCSPTSSTRVHIDLGSDLQSYSTERLGWFKPLLTNKGGKTSPLWLEPGCGILLR
ncbi:MAG: hypothetical protein IJY39_09990 [Clostridia bacterium]|nr:hypothetical protein [Clostridia bacterium]